jgi:histidine kinase
MNKVRTREVLRFTVMLLGVWFVFGVFNTSLVHRRAVATTNGEMEWLPVLVFQTCSSLLWAAFTPFIIAIADALPIRRPHALRNVILLILLVPALGIARAALGGAVLNLSEGDRISVDMFKLSLAVRTHSYSLLAAIIIGATNMMRLARETGESERRQVALRTRLTRTEMDSLRAQLQPELIFRTLQTIAAVIEKDAAAADTMIVTLSQVIRRSLANDGAVPLGDDIELVARYVELYALATGKSLTFRCHVDDDLLDIPVPAFLLQPFVDDAIRASAGHDGAVIEVAVQCPDDSGLLIDIRPHAGEIVETARKRLQRLFGADFLLDNAAMATTLRIPLLEENLIG